MNLQIDSLSRNVDLVKNLSSALLTGSGELMIRQIDNTETFISRFNQHFKASLSEVGSIQDTDQWPERIQNGMNNAIKLSQDYLAAAADYQLETMRLLQEQGAEAQKILSAALNEQLSSSDVAIPSPKRNGRNSVSGQKLAS